MSANPSSHSVQGQGRWETRVRTIVEYPLFNQGIKLATDREWHSTAIQLKAGDELRIRASGNVRFYFGLFDDPDWKRLVRAGGGRFPFKFGTDQVAFERLVRVPADGDYHVVLRVGVFTKPGAIQLSIWLRRIQGQNGD